MTRPDFIRSNLSEAEVGALRSEIDRLRAQVTGLQVSNSNNVQLRRQAEAGLARYEFIRRQDPARFRRLWLKALQDDIPFDTLVDRLIAGEITLSPTEAT